MALRQTWIKLTALKQKAEKTCAYGSKSGLMQPPRDCGTNLMNLLITFHPLLKWKQGTSFEEESTDAEFKHIGYKKIAL